MNLFLITSITNNNISGAKFTKGMSVELHTSLSNPFNNGGREVVAEFVRKYGMDDSRLKSLGPNSFDVKKLS